MSRTRPAATGMQRHAVLECLVEAQRDGSRGSPCSVCGGRMAPIPRRGRETDPMRPTIDHVFPTSRGGRDRPGNFLAAHARCNVAKGDSWPTQEELALLAEVNRKLRWTAPPAPPHWGYGAPACKA